MTMTCQEIQNFVTCYIDGEFAPSEVAEFEDHVAACGACRELVRQEGAFKTALRAKLSRPMAPASLRTSVLSTIATAAADERRLARRGAIVRGLRTAAPFAMAAGVAVALAYTQPEASQPANAPGGTGIASTVAASTVAAAPTRERAPRIGGNGLTFASAGVAMTADAHARSAPLQATGALRLLDAREVTAAHRPAVLYEYDLGGTLLSVVRYLDEGPVAGNGRPLRLERKGALTIGEFVQQGVRYSLVTELEPQDVARLLTTVAR